MTNIYDISKYKKEKKDEVEYTKEVHQLVSFGKEIDDVVISYLLKNVDPHETAVILGHRLSELLRLLESDRHATWDLIKSVVDGRLK